MSEDKSAMHIDAALVRQLAELLDETRLTEIEVQDGDRVRLFPIAPSVLVPPFRVSTGEATVDALWYLRARR